MSWRITKKLKDTHLGPLSAFSRSPSTSTITDKDEKAQQQTTPGATTPTTESAIAASEAMVQAPVIKPPKPGILVVTLHEGQGFSLPEQHRNAFASSHQGSLSSSNVSGIAGSIRPGSSQRVGSLINGSNRPHSSAGGFSGIPTNHGRISGKYMPYALLDFDKVQVFVNSVEGNPENPLWAGGNTQYKFDVSRVTELVIHLYMRNPNAPQGAGRSQDIFLGVARINPRFAERQPYVEDPKASKKDREKAAAEYADRHKGEGHSGVQWVDIKAHPFFHAIDWRKLLQRKYEPAFKPTVVDALDVGQFDKEFTSEAPQDSYVEGPMLSQTAQDQFVGFSYNRPIAGLGDAGGSVKDPSFVGSMQDHR
ncbi:hypothetical protein ACCO45_011953 [Purpureocillium lilacinum]|uniref:Uncharacterized protein n=1 Tax=Purpureocillium lilacinum TaxID=33203 RepID=A0ACC4DCX2_PURLI